MERKQWDGRGKVSEVDLQDLDRGLQIFGAKLPARAEALLLRWRRNRDSSEAGEKAPERFARGFEFMGKKQG